MPYIAKAGEYDQRVRVYKQTTSPTVNDDGGEVESGVQVCRRWASVTPVMGLMTGRRPERSLVGQVQADVTHEVRMRSDSLTRTITPAMWILLRDGTRLDIENVFDVDLRRVEIQLDCNRRV